MASSLRFWYLPSSPFLFLSSSFSPFLSFPFISFLCLPKVAFFASAASLVFSIGPRRLVRCREPQLLPVFLGWRDVTRSAYARGVRRTGLAEITPTRRLRHEQRVTCTRAAVSLPLLRRFLRACIRKDVRFFSFIRRSSMESSFFIGFILIWSKYGTNRSLQSFITYAWYIFFIMIIPVYNSMYVFFVPFFLSFVKVQLRWIVHYGRNTWNHFVNCKGPSASLSNNVAWFRMQLKNFFQRSSPR